MGASKKQIHRSQDHKENQRRTEGGYVTSSKSTGIDPKAALRARVRRLQIRLHAIKKSLGADEFDALVMDSGDTPTEALEGAAKRGDVENGNVLCDEVEQFCKEHVRRRAQHCRMIIFMNIEMLHIQEESTTEKSLAHGRSRRLGDTTAVRWPPRTSCSVASSVVVLRSALVSLLLGDEEEKERQT